MKINATNITIYKLGYNIYITSAHYIDYENSIHLIIYSESSKIRFKTCKIYYSDNNDECYVKIQSEGYLYYRIEFATRKNITPLSLTLNNITIKFNKKKRFDSNSFVVCVPVVANLKRPMMLIQMIESYKNYGVSKIIINYFSSSDNVVKVLNYYSKLGIVDVFKYNDNNDEKIINLQNDSDIIYHLQMWKINHCFYEYKTQSNHLIFLDVDEILFTKDYINYYQLFNSLEVVDLYKLHQFFYKINNSISEQNDRRTTLNDIDIYSINDYCKTSNGFTHKYIIYNTNKFYKAEVHDALHNQHITQQYISSNIAFVRHTRHYNKSVKDICDDYMLIANKTLNDLQMQNNSKLIYKRIIGKDF